MSSHARDTHLKLVTHSYLHFRRNFSLVYHQNPQQFKHLTHKCTFLLSKQNLPLSILLFLLYCFHPPLCSPNLQVTVCRSCPPPRRNSQLALRYVVYETLNTFCNDIISIVHTQISPHSCLLFLRKYITTHLCCVHINITPFCCTHRY